MPSATIISLSVDDAPVTQRVRACEVRQADANHALVILDLYAPASTVTRVVPERTAVLLRWGIRGAVETFYGYVHHHQVISPDANDVRADSVLRYVLLGTSLPMNQQQTRSWRGVSGSYLARTLAKEHGLRSVTHTSPKIYDYFAQNGISDFAVLKKLAAEVGFRCWVNGSTLWFVDPDLLLLGPKALSLPTFSMNNSAASADTLLNLEILNGQTLSEGGVRANRTAYGYDPRTKRFFQAVSGTDDAWLSQVTSIVPVSNLTEASQMLASVDAAARNWVTAKAVVNGSPRLRPGSVVRLNGSGVLSDYQGYWLVKGANHVLRLAGQSPQGASNYTTELELGRNTTKALTFRDSKILSPVVENAPCRLTDEGMWQAALLEETDAG